MLLKIIFSDAFGLCTSKKLKETINGVVISLLFEHNRDLEFNKNVENYRNFFEFETSGKHFLFQGTFYEQIDGCLPCRQPPFYPHGPILCVFNCQSDEDKFFEFLNMQHSNIKFAIEKPINNRMSFLDVLISNPCPFSIHAKLCPQILKPI